MPKKYIKLIESIEMKFFVKKMQFFVRNEILRRNEFLCEDGLNLGYDVDVTCKLQLAKDSV